jgi:hypothetical protein
MPAASLQDDGMKIATTTKVCFPVPLSRSDLHVIKVLLSVTDWYSRDLGIDPRQYRFQHHYAGRNQRREMHQSCLSSFWLYTWRAQ